MIATSGDARLGGNDFDAALITWLADECKRRGVDVRGDKSRMRRLAEAAEAAKKRLSVSKVEVVELPIGEDGAGLRAAEGAMNIDGAAVATSSAVIGEARPLLDERGLRDAKKINSVFPPDVVSYYLYC